MAYAALQSLEQTLERLLHFGPCLVLREKEQTEYRVFLRKELTRCRILGKEQDPYLRRGYHWYFGDLSDYPFRHNDDYKIVKNFGFINQGVILHKKEQIQSLQETVSFLQDFLRDSSAQKSNGQNVIRSLECQIGSLASNAEYIIESHMYDSLQGKQTKGRRKAYMIFEESTQRIIDQMASVEKMVNELKNKDRWVIKSPEEGPPDEPDYECSGYTSSQNVLKLANSMVGFDDDLRILKERLAGEQSRLDVVSIVGMGGIGKTTLARSIYDDPYIVYYFQTRSWMTVSQDYEVRVMLLGLLRGLGQVTNQTYKKSDEQLAEQVYRILKGKRYLIVLDDVWNTEAWDYVRKSFPDDNTGSRIILTSRLAEVATYAHPGNPPHQLRLLSADRSWELLSERVFQERSPPRELVEIGKKIAEKCRGLPLALVVMAGHLSKIRKTRDSWNYVAGCVGTLVTQDQEQCLDILTLSYQHLPQHLKACFLYMGAFPEDYEIPAQRLMKLWIAEGFLQQEEKKIMEEVAEDCLQDLIGRSLIMVRKRRLDGSVKTCGVHDLLRELSLREAQKVNFLSVIKSSTPSSFLPRVYEMSRISCLSTIYGMVEKSSNPIVRSSLIPLNHSFLCFGIMKIPHSTSQEYSLFSFSSFKLLRILDIANPLDSPFGCFPDEITELVLLRYLAVGADNNPPSSLSRLQNLETLVYHRRHRNKILLPSEVWMMQKLRHVHLIDGSTFPIPLTVEIDGNSTFRLVLPNLQSLSTIYLNCCTREVFSGIPNIKKLQIQQQSYPWLPEDGSLSNLVYLRQLEVLKVSIFGQPPSSQSWALPPNLKKLALYGMYVPWNGMTAAALRNIEVLKLKNCFQAKYWELGGECFSRLKYLLLVEGYLTNWHASKIHFPILQRLVLRYCTSLMEIPQALGDIDTLELIELQYCSSSAEASAVAIQEEQQTNGNELDVRIYSFH